MRSEFRLFLALVACSISSAAIAQIPVIPGASGFGITTPAGRGGEVYRVTNLNYDGDGSLKACIDAEGPRVCIFEVSGTIDLAYDQVTIRNPNLTIAGQTAPSPGIVLRNGGLKVAASDVLIQHIAIRVGDDPNMIKPGNADALKIETGTGVAENVVIDHVSLSWGIDENLSSWDGARKVTIRYSIISEGLNESIHTEGPHSKGALFGNSDSAFSLIGNLIAHNVERNPKALTSDFVFANNVVYNYVTGGTNLAVPKDGSPIRHSIVGNVYIEGPDSGNIRPLVIRKSGDTASTDSRVYIADNLWAGHSATDQWDMAVNQLSFSPRASSAPVWPNGLQAMPAHLDNGEQVLDLVLSNAGARPADRDSVDQRVVSEVRQGTGGIINCVSDDGSARCDKNAGGWPQFAENRRTLVLPSNANGDNDGDGYTNLEEWLHNMASDLELQSNATRPLPPVFAGTP